MAPLAALPVIKSTNYWSCSTRTIGRIKPICKSDYNIEVELAIKTTIGDLIRRKRADKAWTQEKLSSEAGISNRFLQKIEAGDRAPSLETIFKLASALAITPDKLITPIWKEWRKDN